MNLKSLPLFEFLIYESILLFLVPGLVGPRRLSRPSVAADILIVLCSFAMNLFVGLMGNFGMFYVDSSYG